MRSGSERSGIVYPWAAGECPWGLDGATACLVREMQADANLLLAFAMMIVGALGAGLPIALVIIWLCS
jgi:hypothetical protein